MISKFFLKEKAFGDISAILVPYICIVFLISIALGETDMSELSAVCMYYCIVLHTLSDRLYKCCLLDQFIC